MCESYWSVGIGIRQRRCFLDWRSASGASSWSAGIWHFPHLFADSKLVFVFVGIGEFLTCLSSVPCISCELTSVSMGIKKTRGKWYLHHEHCLQWWASFWIFTPLKTRDFEKREIIIISWFRCLIVGLPVITCMRNMSLRVVHSCIASWLGGEAS